MVSPIDRLPLTNVREIKRPPLVTLECPRCNATKQVPRMHRDPPMTARVVVVCPACDPSNTDRVARYFRADGHEICRRGR